MNAKLREHLLIAAVSFIERQDSGDGFEIEVMARPCDCRQRFHKSCVDNRPARKSGVPDPRLIFVQLDIIRQP
jgi:hypothetical protein